ncbi:hypothetical protein Tco_1039751 [Tanacetum coccineum]
MRLLFLVLQDTKLMAEMLLGRHNKRVEVKKAVSKRNGKIRDYYNTYNAIFNGSYGVYFMVCMAMDKNMELTVVWVVLDSAKKSGVADKFRIILSTASIVNAALWVLVLLLLKAVTTARD